MDQEAQKFSRLSEKPEISDLKSEGAGPRSSQHAVVIGKEVPIVGPIEDYESYILKLKRDGRGIRSDKDQPSLSQRPPWFEPETFARVKSLYERHMMALNFAHLSGLLLLVRVDSIFVTLSATGESSSVSKLFKRYYYTLRHVKRWYEGDIFDPKCDAQQSLLIVRGMHNKVSEKFNDKATSEEDDDDESELKAADSACCPVHISQYDIMLTQFAFIGFIMTNPKKIGLIEDFNRGDLESLVHFWRVIGYYLGLSERYNLCSYEIQDIVGLCKAFIKLEYRKSILAKGLDEPPGIMSVNIVRAVKFIPLITFYGMMKHIYEIIDHDVSEVEQKRTWYSNLSYNLITLVLTRLLAYKPFRVFNNGLIRLSIYLVGKYEGAFSRHLESKFGQGLRA